jgi:SPP1 family predicted phage head-tail adaptor
MRPGTLNKPVEVQTFTETRGSKGQIERTPDLLDTRMASIEPLSGQEIFDARQVQSQATHKVKMWQFPGLKPADQLKFEGRIFNIESVLNPEEAGVASEIMCVEETD